MGPEKTTEVVVLQPNIDPYSKNTIENDSSVDFDQISSYVITAKN
jgi:hypothetical protein